MVAEQMQQKRRVLATAHQPNADGQREEARGTRTRPTRRRFACDARLADLP